MKSVQKRTTHAVFQSILRAINRYQRRKQGHLFVHIERMTAKKNIIAFLLFDLFMYIESLITTVVSFFQSVSVAFLLGSFFLLSLIPNMIRVFSGNG